MKKILEKEEYAVIKKRIDDVAKALQCTVHNAFLIFYEDVKNESERAKASGGADKHHDNFPLQHCNPMKTDMRALDTWFSPNQGEKLMTFIEDKTGDYVTLSIPHGTVVICMPVRSGV